MKEAEEYKSFSLVGKMHTYQKKVNLEADCKDCEEKIGLKDTRAVALIGDNFYHDAFLPAIELEKAASKWENTLHDVNHQGTSDARGLMMSSNILYFIGYNNNVTYDKETKSVSMDINVVDNTHYSSAWRGYVELCELAGQTPNVSVSFLAKTKRVKVSDLPEGVDYSSYGYSEDDVVNYIYDIQPQALSTVFRGACDDEQGCGIGKCSNQSAEVKEDNISEEEVTEDSREREEIIKWLKSQEKEE
jgi:hypothetical protein